MLQSMGLEKVGHDLVTELTTNIPWNICAISLPIHPLMNIYVASISRLL